MTAEGKEMFFLETDHIVRLQNFLFCLSCFANYAFLRATP